MSRGATKFNVNSHISHLRGRFWNKTRALGRFALFDVPSCARFVRGVRVRVCVCFCLVHSHVHCAHLVREFDSQTRFLTFRVEFHSFAIAFSCI